LRRSFFTVAVVMALFLAAAGGSPLAAASERVALTKVDVVDLPPTCEPGQPFIVKDGNSASDCVTGTGSTKVLCTCDDSGSSYSATGDGNSGGTPTQIVAGDSDMTVTDAGVGDITATVDGVTAMVLNGVGSGVNYVDITPSITAVGPTIAAEGETNVDLNLSGKGTGQAHLGGCIDDDLDGTCETFVASNIFNIDPDDDGDQQMTLTGSGNLRVLASAANTLIFTGNSNESPGLFQRAAQSATLPVIVTYAGHGPTTGFGGQGSGGDAGYVSTIINSIESLRVAGVASGVNRVQITPGATGTGSTIASAGEATVPLVFTTAGTANFDFSDDNINASGGIDLPADAVDALTEIAQSIKTAANDTDPLAVYTGGNPGSNVCVEMTSTGTLIAAADTCANLGPGGATAINDLGDAGGVGVVQVGTDQEWGQTWTWNTPVTTVAALDGLKLIMDLDATTDVQTQSILALERSDGAGTTALEAILKINNAEVTAAVISGIEIRSAAGGMTSAIDANDAQITNIIEHAGGSVTSSDLDIIDDGTVDGGTGGDIGDGTIDGEDINANYAGAYLTETAASPDTLGVDDEVVRRTFTFIVEAPTTAEDGDIQHMLDVGCTIDRVQCSVAAATSVTININERAIGTPNSTGDDALSSGLVCDVGSQSSCASGCDVDTIQNQPIDATDPIALEIDSVIGSPGWLRVHVTCKVSD